LSIVEQVMRNGAHSEEEMRRVAVDWMTPGRPWVRRYLETLLRRLPGGAAESHPETVIGDALAAAGLVGLERQYRIAARTRRAETHRGEIGVGREARLTGRCIRGRSRRRRQPCGSTACRRRSRR
jgi:hypothetical protein